MKDAEFINYCETHSETERAGFVPDHIHRILKLAGEDELAKDWADQHLNIVSVYSDEMKPLCAKARKRLAPTLCG